MDTEPWKAFQAREAELKGFVHSLSTGKIDDLLWEVRFGKYLEDHPKSIEGARAFRERRSDNVVGLGFRRLLADPYRENLEKYIARVV